MLTDDFCSFEVAKLLKEKGFNVPVWTRYEDDEDKDVIFGDKYDWNSSPMGQTSTPTHQMAVKWLREKDIRICPDYSDVDGKWFTMIGTKKKRTYSGYYDTYEEAVEAACLYSLKNLIKKVKT